jgi:hypothetical protein
MKFKLDFIDFFIVEFLGQHSSLAYYYLNLNYLEN